MDRKYDVIIIGAGIAGITSAIYLKRAGLNILLLEKSAPGGQITRISKIENYPGIKEIDGATLALNLYEQLKSLDIKINYSEIIDIKINNNTKIVKTIKDEYETKNIIIATGREPKKLEIENIDNLIGHGVSFCATCDGSFYKNKIVCVVGGGNTALEEALYLSNICNKVYLIHRNETFKAENILINEINKKNNIQLILNSEVKQIKEENNLLHSIVLNNNNEIICDGLFIAIGSIPKTSFINNTDIKSENNYIIVDKNRKTNIEGIYAIGDVIKKDVYQIVTAAHDGVIAASDIIKNTFQ